ncbi:MAG: flagellar export chaperone FliS [Nakamurella sp.]
MSIGMRARYLNERVLTATPGQRVVMLYDRLALDLVRAGDIYATDPTDTFSAGQAIDHAMAIVAELAGSLRATPNSPADNLASIYSYLIRELTAVRGGQSSRLAGTAKIVGSLREAWTTAIAQTASTPTTAGAWVG